MGGDIVRSPEQINRRPMRVVPLSEQVNATDRQILPQDLLDSIEQSRVTQEDYKWVTEKDTPYLTNEIDMFLSESGNKSRLEENPDIASILSYSMQFMYAGTGGHSEKIPLMQKLGTSFSSYVSLAATPKTACSIFNSGYIRVFESICRQYAPEVLERYRLLPVSALASADLARRSEVHLSNRVQTHAFPTLISMTKDSDIALTVLDPYHVRPAVQPENISDLDFSTLRSSDAISALTVAQVHDVGSFERTRGRGKGLQEIDLSTLSNPDQLGVAIHSALLLPKLEAFRKENEHDYEVLSQRLQNEKQPKPDIEDIFDDYMLDALSKLNDIDFSFGGTSVKEQTEEEKEAAIEAHRTNAEEMRQTRDMSYNLITLALEEALAADEDPITLEMAAEVIDTAFIQGIMLPEHLLSGLQDRLRQSKADPDEYFEHPDYKKTVRKHGIFDTPHFPSPESISPFDINHPDTDLSEDWQRYALLYADLRVDYFTWLARQDLTEWVDRLPSRKDADYDYYRFFLIKLEQEMARIGYDTNTHEGQKLKDLQAG